MHRSSDFSVACQFAKSHQPNWFITNHFHNFSPWLANITLYTPLSNANVSLHNYYSMAQSTCWRTHFLLPPFFSFFPFTFRDTPATLQHVARGPVMEPDGTYFCFLAFLLFFLFSARKSKNKGTPRHHNIDPFDAFHRLSPSHVQPVASQRSHLKPQEKPNWPPTSKRAALRSHHMRP